MAKDKDEVVTVDEERTVEETTTTTEPATETVGFLAADQGQPEPGPETDEFEPAPPSTPYPSNTAGDYQPDPEREAMYLRQSALSLAAQPGIHEAKEPILAVLARAEAYRLYMETGQTGIVE